MLLTLFFCNVQLIPKTQRLLQDLLNNVRYQNITVLIKNIFFLVIEEKGVRLKLTITDTPGFGDQINNESWLDFNSV